ncbi:unnamed protein product, partial [Pocillopora meandrina]
LQVLIQETGERRIAALGAVHESYDCHKMPGWDSGTVGYHIDEGKIFETGFHKQGREVEGAMAYRGDLIACEVDFRGVPEGKVSVLFFLNGIEIRVLQCSIPREINYFLSFHWDLKALQCSP